MKALLIHLCLYVYLCSKYYEREALMHDSVFGPILAALLGKYITLCFDCQYIQNYRRPVQDIKISTTESWTHVLKII